MTLKTLVAAAGISSFLLTSACENAADTQQKANAAQVKANEQIAQVARESAQKMKASQAEADKKIAEAQATFSKLRDDYRHATETAMVDLDKKISDLETKAVKATGKAKAEVLAKLEQLKASRDTFLADCKALDTATAGGWDALKARLDKQRAELQTMADDA